MTTPGVLVDRFGRRIEYLRVSVIERCNLRCVYCRPASSGCAVRAPRPLDAADLSRLVGAFARLGVRRVRLTGGEPLVRRDLVEVAAGVAALPGVEDLSLSTNGELLARRAAALRAAGVSRVNVSLDSLDPDAYARITRGGRLSRVLAGIDAALEAGLAPLKLNMVVMAGVNAHEIPAMLDFAVARGLELRFIETMPVGAAGGEAMARHLPAARILDQVRAHAGVDLMPVAPTTGGGPARCYRLGAGAAGVGVISAVSRHFCAGCNRVRLTASGDLVLCLGQENRVPLRAALAAGPEALEAAIRAAIAAKPWGHRFGEGVAAGANEMSGLGG